jgi:hypothetical protein
MKIRSISLPDDLDQRVAHAAGKQPYSAFVRELLEHSLTGADRLKALEEIAADGLRAYADAASAPRGPNATEVIAESCADGRARLDALQKIATGRGK